MPEVQALFALLIPVSLTMVFFVHLPIWIAMFTFFPLYCLILTVFIDLAGFREFLKAHGRKWSRRQGGILVLSFFPYQWMLGIGSLRAVYRHIRGASDWEKTAHLGQHRRRVGVDVTRQGAPETEPA